MGITAKELAQRLGLSPAAVSMALNGKPGVSTETRKLVLRTARELGYDFSKVKGPKENRKIYYVIYKKDGAVVDNTPFFAAVLNGITRACQEADWKLEVKYLDEANFYKYTDRQLLASEDCAGFLLLGTEMTTPDIQRLLPTSRPTVLLDSYFETFPCETVVINNKQGAYMATRLLIKKYRCAPGYLKSSYLINNFLERAEGFYKAVRVHGISASHCIEHALTPSIEGAYEDMKRLLAQGEPLARCYFADNDYIAIGAMRAFQEAGIRIPEDVALIGFDNIPSCQATNPPLSTVHVPKEQMGQTAVLRLLHMIREPNLPFLNIEVSTSLIERGSC